MLRTQAVGGKQDHDGSCLGQTGGPGVPERAAGSSTLVLGQLGTLQQAPERGSVLTICSPQPRSCQRAVLWPASPCLGRICSAGGDKLVALPAVLGVQVLDDHLGGGRAALSSGAGNRTVQAPRI